jgi:6-pyruvoyltetrahydropterin/6-carboxytetrahydropterin synthase
MYTICKRWTFDAAHKLIGLPPGHKCSRMHGHTYAVEVEVSASELNDQGFVIDFAVLAPIKTLIDNVYDHRFLNDVMDGKNPTAENLARIIHEQANMIYMIRRLDPSEGPAETTITIPCIALVTTQVEPLPEGVTITAVRVSETGSSWAEYRP